MENITLTDFTIHGLIALHRQTQIYQLEKPRSIHLSVKIRLKKLGRKHRPFFRVCAMDIRSPRDGRVIEELGYYDPMVPETDARAILNGERIDHWISVGATPTPKVGVLIKKYGSSGSHLSEQQKALQRLASRRGISIEAARRAAAAAEVAAKAGPVVAPAPPVNESPADDGVNVEAATDVTTESGDG